MVAIMENFFEKSKQYFDTGDIDNTLESYEKMLLYIDPQKDKSALKDYIAFLEKLLEHCKQKDMKEQGAIVLRTIGRTYSIFKQHVKSLEYHKRSLKIQRKLGNKYELAEGLVYLAEDLEVSGDYAECINMFSEAAKIYHELGKLRKEKEIRKELKRLEKFSEEMVEDEYILNKFHIDKF
ncbi:MAG: tetratricopeptide repeat protein [Promethearchaeota archaeon]